MPAGEAGVAAEALDEMVAPSVDAAAIRMAFAVGMFWAAWRPRAAMGMTPVYGAAAMFSIGFATRDLVLGTLQFIDVAALALMAWMLTRDRTPVTPGDPAPEGPRPA